MQYSVVPYSEVNNKQNILRIDAEFYKPFFIEINKTVKSNPYKEFEKFIDLLTDYHANGGYETLKSHVELKDEIDDVLMVRTVNLENDDFSNNKYISLDAYNFLKKTKLFGGELIINKIGSPGRTYLMPTLQTRASLGMNQFLVRLKDNDYSCLLYVYFNSKYGKNIIEQRITGAVPLSIDKVSIKKLLVPDFSKEFAIKIKKLFDQKSILEESSKSLYAEAENLLLEELGLKDWKPKHQLSYVKNYSDTQQAERFDAEYFQPQYDAIIERIKNYKNGFDFAKKIISLNNKNYQPIGDKDYRYIELSNISQNGEINGFIESKGEELPSRARRKVKKGDLILSSIEGSLDSISMITDNYENMLCSTGFFVANSKNINAETALIFFKSKVGQLQLKKGCSGTILTAIGSDEFNKILIPTIEQKVQDEIREKISKMYLFKSQSKSLLEIAKKAVEMAIESNEEKATKWIDQELEKLGVQLSSD